MRGRRSSRCWPLTRLGHAASGSHAGGARDGRANRPTPRPRRGIRRIADSPAPLIDALHEVERELGRPRPTVLAHAEAIDLLPLLPRVRRERQFGPFFLETLLNPDLTGPERPVVLAHEWAHLSGYAPESDASYVGFLAACARTPRRGYSAWLDLALSRRTNSSRSRSVSCSKVSRLVRVPIRRRSASG